MSSSQQARNKQLHKSLQTLEWERDRLKEENDSLKRQLAEAEAEAAALKDWKESALITLNKIDTQKVSQILELPLGTDVYDAIMRKLPDIMMRVKRIEEALNEIIQQLCWDETTDVYGHVKRVLETARAALVSTDKKGATQP